jgi:hypothetical protein
MLSAVLVCACALDHTHAPQSSGDPWDIVVQHDPKLGTRLQELGAAAGVPGIGAAILRNDSVAVAVAGRRRADEETPLAEGDLFHLGMSACGFGPTAIATGPDGNWAHDVKDGQYVPTEEDNPQLIGPAGTVHCALESWARFAAAHAHPESGGWITPASMSRLHSPFAVDGTSEGKDIGLGWGVTRTAPPRLTHSGSNGFNVAEIVVIPRLYTAVLVTCNAGDERARRVCSEIRDLLVEEVLDGH